MKRTTNYLQPTNTTIVTVNILFLFNWTSFPQLLWTGLGQVTFNDNWSRFLNKVMPLESSTEEPQSTENTLVTSPAHATSESAADAPEPRFNYKTEPY